MAWRGDTSANVLLNRLALLVIFFVLVMVLLRMGLAASAAAFFFINSPGHTNIGPGFRGWYTPSGLAMMALLIGIAVYAFWRSIGARTIEDEEQG